MSEFGEFYFSSRLSRNRDSEKVWRQVAKFLKKYISGTVVDLGCGHGDFLRGLSEGSAKRKIGIDVFKSPHFPVDSEFFKSSSQNFHKFVKNSDVVFASNLFEHLNDEELEETMAAVTKSLRKGGLLILMQPNFRHYHRRYFDDYTHKKIFTDVSLSDYVRSKGFEIVKVYPKFLPASLKSRLPKWNILTWTYLRSPFKPFAGQMLIIARKK